MGKIVITKELSTALAGCSPNIVKFLKALDSGDSIIDWAFLDRNGFKKNGSYFKVVDSTRSMLEQITNYEKGRSCNISKKFAGLNAVYPFAGTKYTLNGSSVLDGSKVVTKVFGGKSYHNYGLAVDIVPYKTGWTMENVNGTRLSIERVYEYSKIPELAKKYGLEWGGSWSALRDPWHFQDSSYKIPEGYNFNYDRNCNFDFIRDFNAGKFNGLNSVGSSSTAGSGFFRLLPFIVGGVALFYLKLKK